MVHYFLIHFFLLKEALPLLSAQSKCLRIRCSLMLDEMKLLEVIYLENITWVEISPKKYFRNKMLSLKVGYRAILVSKMFCPSHKIHVEAD